MSTVDAPPRRYATRGGAALATAPAPARRPAAPRPVAEPRGRHLRVVRPSDRRRRRLSPAAAVLATGALFAVLFLIATAHSLLVQGQVRLDQLDQQLTVEQARYQELRKDVSAMESPERIVAAAQDLGMVAPDDLVYLQPEPDDAPPLQPEGETPDAGATETGAGPSSTWGAMKPLLEAPAP
jgi:cell division protein FtsB